jgi:uncharacterized protein (TIGR02996 family)
MTGNIAETPEGRQFHRSICATPDDDTPRLVFADWLEEQGYTDQAEFIRLSFGIWPSTRTRQDYDALLAANKRAWIWPIAELLGDDYARHAPYSATGAELCRGFVSSLTIPANLLLPNARAIFSIQPITWVYLAAFSWTAGTGNGDRIATQCGRRHVLHFFNSDLTRRGQRNTRLPGAIFSFLPRAGLPCTMRGTHAVVELPPHRHPVGLEIVSRAAVAFGRHQAGLPALTWPPLR